MRRLRRLSQGMSKKDLAGILQEGISFRLLTDEACLEAEPLWREVFTEDTEAFTEYYFTEKAVRNRGLILEGAGQIRSMLYLTPECMRVMGREIPSAYIVGVATEEGCRHRGYMAYLLEKAMNMLYMEKMPFVFLMPASPDIYTPFGFTWIYDRPEWDACSLKREKLNLMQEKDADRMAAFAQEFLDREKKVYVSRDRAYYIQQIAELKAQEGCIFGYEKAERGEERKLKGLCMYVREEGRPEILEILADAETENEFVLRHAESKPAIMARIVCAQQMLSLLRSRKTAEFVMLLTDPLLKENNGKFFCSMREDGTFVERCQEERRADLEMDITELTAVLFGYRKPENSVMREMIPLSPVWINEIV